MTLLLLCWGSRNSCSCTGSTTSLCSSIPGTRIRTWWLEAVGSWPWTLQCTRSCTATTLHVLLVCTCLMCWLCSSPALRSLRWPWAWRCACSSTTGCHRVTAPPMWTISGGRGLCTSATCCSLQISSTKPTYGHETTVTRAKRPSPGKWNRMQQVEKEIVLKLWKKFYILTEYMFFVLLYLLIFPGTVLGSVWGVTNYPTIRFTVYRNSSRGCYNFSELIEYTSAKDFIVRLYVQLFNFFFKIKLLLAVMSSRFTEYDTKKGWGEVNLFSLFEGHVHTYSFLYHFLSLPTVGHHPLSQCSLGLCASGLCTWLFRTFVYKDSHQECLRICGRMIWKDDVLLNMAIGTAIFCVVQKIHFKSALTWCSSISVPMILLWIGKVFIKIDFQLKAFFLKFKNTF